MKQIGVQLREGMAKNGITGATAERIINSITSFALYGFPESHAASFALLAYASAYLKAHYPAAFYAALLNNQPMGFYHPSTLVKDAQRRGVRFHPIDVQVSDWNCTVGEDGAIRLGLRYVAGMRDEAGKTIALAARHAGPGPRFKSLDDLVNRTGVRRAELVTLADIGALNSFGYDRRSALWQAEQAARPSGELFEDDPSPEPLASSPLRPMTESERIVADYAGTGLTVGRHPMALRRDELATRGVSRAIDLRTARQGRRVRVAGMVITRQRPGTAKGFVFLTLEDETGIANIIVRPDLFIRDRLVITDEPFLLVDGVLQNQDGVTSVRAERITGLHAGVVQNLEFDAHDFY